MARFEEGETGATAVVRVTGADIEDAAEQMYGMLGFGELDLVSIDRIYGTFA